METQMYSVPRPVGSLLVAFYCWVVTALFGATLLDVVYARAIRGAFDPAQAATLFSRAADFLLLLVALGVLAAIGAIGGAWQSSLARSLLLASALLLVGEVLAPIVLRPFVLAPGAGAWVRLLLGASASALSLLGLSKLHLRS